MASIEMVEKLRSRAGVTYEDAREALDSSDDDMLDALIWLEKNGKTVPPRVSYYTTDSNKGAGRDNYSDIDYERSDRYYDSSKQGADRNAKKSKKDKQRNQAHKSDSRTADKKSGRSSDYRSGRSADNRSDTHAYYYDERDVRRKASSFAASALGFIAKAFHVGNTTMIEVTRYGKDIIKIPLTLFVVACFMFFHVILILMPVGLFFGFRYIIESSHFNSNPINTFTNTAADAVDGLKEAFGQKKQKH
ncbi:MAG: hypothetical protein FWH01_01195 [Oscillospiraceae bacterium]|nr:hypothetical protein [Oscillospiraceae bacterium]